MTEPEVWGVGCECWVTPREQHYVYYGITEPGSAAEWNPECPKHARPTTEGDHQ